MPMPTNLSFINRSFLQYYIEPSMSGFLSSEAEGALRGDEHHAERLFNEHLLVDDNSRWAHAHTSPNGLDYFHPEPSRPTALDTTESTGSTSLTTVDPASRSTSPHTHDLNNYGFLNNDNRSWRCAYPGCASKAVFVRPCDLRKHFNRHSKNYHCRYDGCAQATEGGFSSKKDRARHEAKHNPGVQCECEGCERIFSRRDNMLDHVRRIHRKSA